MLIDKTLKCPACESNYYMQTETCDSYTILYCRSCGLSFANPMRGGDSKFYKEHLVYKPADEVTISQHCNSAAKPENMRLLAMLPKGSKVLDVGCGYGAFVYYAVNQGYDATGLDFNDEHVKAGQTFLGLGERLLVGDINDLQMSDRNAHSFDLVTLFEVIEHVENPKELIQDVREVLCDGGLLALSCPNESRWHPFGRIFVDFPPHHLTRWRPDTLQHFLERQGFEHVSTEIESSICDVLWVAYVNRSAKRKYARSGSGENTPQASSQDNVRRYKMHIFNLARQIFKPMDLILRIAGIGTMGMRMIVRKV